MACTYRGNWGLEFKLLSQEHRASPYYCRNKTLYLQTLHQPVTSHFSFLVSSWLTGPRCVYVQLSHSHHQKQKLKSRSTCHRDKTSIPTQWKIAWLLFSSRFWWLRTHALESDTHGFETIPLLSRCMTRGKFLKFWSVSSPVQWE